MKNRPQTERKNRTKPQEAQESRGGSTIADCREIHISAVAKKFLVQIGKRLNADPREIGERAIGSYVKFVEKNPTLAEAQRKFVHCDALLGCIPESRLRQLSRVCTIFHFDADQVADTAISAFVIYAAQRTGELEKLLKDEPGSMDPESIEYILSLPSEAASSFISTSADLYFREPFIEARTKLAGLLELTRHHPGLRKEAEALEMILEGANRLE